MKFWKSAVCLLFLTGTLAHATIGDSFTGNTLGVHAGPAIVGNGSGLRFDLGANASFPLNVGPPLFIAGNFSWIDRGTISTDSTSAKGSTYLVDGSLNYDTSPWVPNSYLGVALGVGWDKTSATIGTVSSSTSSSSFYIGPRAGADYPFASSFTIGGEADWLLATGSNPNVLELLAVLKWWF